MAFENFYSKGHQIVDNTGDLIKIIDDTFKEEPKKVFKRKVVYPSIFLASLIVGKCSSTNNNNHNVEKVENIQNFIATSSAGGNVIGSHSYSINGASGSLGKSVSAGFTNKDTPVTTDIIVTGNDMIARIYLGVNIYGTQLRKDSLSANGRVDVKDWTTYIKENTTWGHPSMIIEFYGNNIPPKFKDAVIASFKEYASTKNKLLKPENISGRDAGVWPGKYTPKKGVIQVVTDPQASGMGNHSNQIDGVTCAGLLAPNPCFGTGVYGMLDGERNDLLQGPSNVDGNLMNINTLIHGANMHAEGRKGYKLIMVNGSPMEYQNGFSGNTTQSSTAYSTLKNMPGTISMFGSNDDDIPDNEKMVVRRRYGKTPRMEDIIRNQKRNNHNPKLTYKNHARRK